MIPKVLHYCWFGGNALPEFAIRCIESWKQFCPDYEIKQWNESNFNLDCCSYLREAYDAKKWAFVSDYARLKIIYENGGIYLDTDVELVKSLDCLLDYECFLGVETLGKINTGLGFGAVQNSKAVRAMLDEYEGAHFKIANGIYDTHPCPERNTAPFIKEGFNGNCRSIQHLMDAVVFPPEYFCPIDYVTKEMQITEKTISIHHFSGTWISSEEMQWMMDVDKYQKTHSKLKTFLYKNKQEYILLWKSKRSFIYFIVIKIKKKIWEKFGRKRA